jgi:hypothetical protein
MNHKFGNIYRILPAFQGQMFLVVIKGSFRTVLTLIN